jgi:hypothetical protein
VVVDRWEFDLELADRADSTEDPPHEDFSDPEHAGGDWTFPEDDPDDDVEERSDEGLEPGEPSNEILEQVRRWSVSEAAGKKRAEQELAETLERVRALEIEKERGWQ